MLLTAALLLGLQAAPVPVPGLCTAPAAEHRGQPGCYLAAELEFVAPRGEVYWHMYTFSSAAAAKKAAATVTQAIVTEAHGKVWLHVIGAKESTVAGGTLHTSIGPLIAPTQGHARILESWFPPGMTTRAHSHPGTEVFYVVEGEQCVETPEGGTSIPAGRHYVLTQGPHLQAAPQGRRSLVLLLLPMDVPWMTLEKEWVPTGYCSKAGSQSNLP